jgi:hypothetical protein
MSDTLYSELLTYRVHVAAFARPICGIVLAYTQRVNPDVSKAQTICDDHSLLECFGEISPRDVLLEFCQVCFRSLDECHIAPAMTQAHIRSMM